MTVSKKRLTQLASIVALASSTALSIQTGFAFDSKSAQAAGAVLFRDKGCAYCHGATTGGTLKGPSLLNIRKIWKAPKIAAQIENGGQKMPAFGDSLSKDEIAQLVAYLRARHRPIAPPLVPTPAKVSNPEQ